jgi:serine/threonine-protein kinase
MSTDYAESAEREGQWSEALVACLEAIDRGQPPDRQELLTRYPDFAPALAQFLADQDRVDGWAAPLRQVVASSATAVPSPDPTIPTALKLSPQAKVGRFGDYELMAEIGRGGMGIVYKARQISLNRLVALKMIRADLSGSPTEVHRFRNEAETIASLDHRHIVPVYEVAEQDGHLYFTMKLIEGGSLAERIEGYATDPRSAARLLAQVARALHHAHQRGILHRDLKPSNILVDADGRPLITDFGLAKRVQTDSDLTQPGVLVGTPSYMAPEQTSGRLRAVTTATDVYQLGAILYALLTRRPPFRGDTVLDTLRLVRETEPEPPGKANARVDQDLQTICLKCLEKEAGRRYGSAEALAQDLERWLAGEPIRARRIGIWQRAGKWVKRRPAVATLLGLLAAAVLGLLIGTFWHNAQLRAAAEREHRLAEQARRQRDEAQRKRELARRAVNDMYTQVAMDWLAHEPQLTEVQRQFLRKALEFYKELASEGGSDTGQWLKTGQAYCRVGDIAGLFPGEEDGEAAYRQARAIFQRLAAEFPQESKYRQELAETERKLGTFLDVNDRFAEAEEFLSRALARSVQLAKEWPNDVDVRESRAACLQNVGSLWRRVGRSREADNALRLAVEAWENLATQFPEVLRYQESLGNAYKKRYMLLLEADCLEKAGQTCRKAIAVHDKVLKGSSARWIRLALSGSYSARAYILAELNDLTEAEKASEQALRLRQPVDAEFPPDPRVQHTLALRYSYRGRLLTLLGRPRDAESAYQQAVKLERKQVELNPAIPGRRQELAMMLGYLAWLHAYGPAPVRDAGKALREAEEAFDLAPGHGPYLTTVLGAVHYRLGDGKRAASLLQSAQVMSQSPTRPAQAWIVTSSLMKRDAEARERLAPALGLFFLAMNHWKRHEKDRARDCYRQALRQLAALRITARLPREELEAIRAEAAALLELAP